MAARPEKLTTSYRCPWALVRRSGDTVGKRPSTRMAFIVAATARNGKIISFTGYVMNNDLTNWTKGRVKIDPADIVREWRHEPTAAAVKSAKAKLPVVKTEADRWGWGGRERLTTPETLEGVE